MNFEDLKVFHTFNWLLTKEQSDKHNQWVANMFGGKGKSGGKSSASSGEPAQKKRQTVDKSAVSSQATASDKAMDYFR